MGVILAVSLTVESFAQSGIWTTKAPMLSPRAQMAVAVAGGTIYTLGGISPTFFPLSIVGMVDAYNPVTNRWSSKAPMLTPRTYPAAGVVEGIVYVVGGLAPPTEDNPLAEHLSTMEAYDPKNDTWSNKAPMPTPRELHVVGVIHHIVYAVGGIPFAMLTPVTLHQRFSQR